MIRQYFNTLQLLADSVASREKYLGKFEENGERTETDDDEDREAPMTNKLYQEDDTEALEHLCSYYMDGWNGVWERARIGIHIEHVSNSGRGNISSHSAKEVFYGVKNPESWRQLGIYGLYF